MSSRSRLVVPVLGLGQMFAFASSYYLLGVLADPMARAFGLAPTRLFAALSVAFLISAVFTPLAGRWIERRGGRRVLGWAHVAFAGALALMAAAPSGVVVLAAVAALGVGMSFGLYGTAFAVLVEIHGDAARRPITAVSLLGALGGGLGWPISRVLLEAWDWRVACACWAAVHVLLCLPLTAFVLPRREAVWPVGAAPRQPIVWDRRMLQIAGVFAGGWMVSTAMGAHLPRLLSELGLRPEHAAWAAGLMGAGAVAARLFDLLILHRSHPVLTARIATLFHPIGAVLALCGVRLAPMLAIGQGLGNGLLSVASGVLPLHVFGPERYAVRQALVLTPARYLQAAAPAAYALAIEVSPVLALAVSSALCLGMFALTLGLRPNVR